MLKINKKVEYALMALKFIADKNSTHSESCADSSDEHPLTSAREVCDQFNIPFDTTAKVMQLMNNQEILKSTKGIKGGYYLKKNLSDITYMDLVRLIEGKEVGRICVGSKGTCELFSKCNIITPIELLNRKLTFFLESLTLADLLQETIFPPYPLSSSSLLNSTEGPFSGEAL